MKVCTYSRQSPYGRIKRLGVFYNDSTIMDPAKVWELYFDQKGFYNSNQKALYKISNSLHDLLRLSESPIDLLKETISLYEKQTAAGDFRTYQGADTSFDLNDDDSSKLECPLDKINCYRDFYAHEKHVAAGFKKRNEPIPEAWYEIPAYYKGPTSGFIGHEDDITWPFYSKKLDFELELACIMGRDGKNIKAKNAYDYIFGFSILNDISARDIQKKEMAIRLGPAKGKDFCTILGPVITTADEFNFQDPDLLMRAFINDQKWSEGRSIDSHYSWGEMIEHVSKDEWIIASDVLGSGTVGTGCGLELDRWIQPSDKIELIVEGIGSLKNIVGIPSKD